MDETCCVDPETGLMVGVYERESEPEKPVEPDVIVVEPVADPVKPSRKGKRKKSEEKPVPATEPGPEAPTPEEEGQALLTRLRAFALALEDAVVHLLAVNVPEVASPLLAKLKRRGCELNGLWVPETAPLNEKTAQLTAEGWEPFEVQPKVMVLDGKQTRGWVVFWRRRVQ